MTHEERTKRAEHAQRLLEDDYFISAFNDIREKLVSALEDCNIGDHQKQTSISDQIRQLSAVKKMIIMHINDGKIAKHEIDRMNNPKVKRVA